GQARDARSAAVAVGVGEGTNGTRCWCSVVLDVAPVDDVVAAAALVVGGRRIQVGPNVAGAVVQSQPGTAQAGQRPADGAGGDVERGGGDILLGQVRLLDVRPEEPHPRLPHRGIAVVRCSNRQPAHGVVVVVHRQAPLMEVVLALQAGGGLTDLLDG